MRSVLIALAAVAAAAGIVAATAPAAQLAGPSPASTTPRVWAAQVCTAVRDWQKKLTARALTLSKVTGRNLRRLRTALAGFLAGVVLDTDALIAGVDRAGTPSVPHGAAIRGGFHAGLVQTRNYFVADARTARKLPLGNPLRFAAGTAALGKAIQKQGTAITTTFARLQKRYGSAELDRAMKPVRACSALS